MGCPIDRRDFLNGLAVTTGAVLAGPMLPGVLRQAQAAAGDAAPQDRPGYYPPLLQGLRGSHPGAFEAAHKLRDGDLSLPSDTPSASDESYDLVIVGGGISGLSAAHFYREEKPDARILILENHDDFGGHAKRNEFNLGGRLELLNGGTLEIDSPRPYSVFATGLLKKLGVDPVRLEEVCAKKDFYESQGLGHGIFFDRETFGADRLITGVGKKPWADLLATAPLSEAARRDIARIEDAKTDYMPGLDSDAKKARLTRMSYRDYLLNVVKADPGVIAYYQAKTHGEWGVGIDAVPALDVWAFDFPGFQGLNLAAGAAPHMGYTAAGYAEGGSAVFHFPDGNASIARLLVRDLIPAALPGHSAEDIVTARADYSQLDRAGAPVRIRLSSIVVQARNLGKDGRDGVEIGYIRSNTVHRVRGKACVLACWNMMIPYLCPDLPDRQKEALHYLVKTPLVYTSVALRNRHSFEKLGIAEVYAPGSYHTEFRLNPVVDIGRYASPTSPEDPVLLHMVKTPCKPGLDEREQNREGRAELLATSFEDFERHIRDQLGRTLSSGGFDPAKDITAITVNRWPHGYAYEYNLLFDPDWDEHDQPHVVGRQPFGRITIANSDSGAAAYTDSAIDQARRAVSELLAIQA